MRELMALALLLFGGCSSPSTFSLELASPPMTLTPSSGAHSITGDVTHGDAHMEFFYVASTNELDDLDSPAPIRLSLTVPFTSATTGDGDDHAQIMFHAPWISCPDLRSAWSGSVEWAKPLPNYELQIDAACINGDDQVHATLKGRL